MAYGFTVGGGNATGGPVNYGSPTYSPYELARRAEYDAGWDKLNAARGAAAAAGQPLNISALEGTPMAGMAQAYQTAAARLNPDAATRAAQGGTAFVPGTYQVQPGQATGFGMVGSQPGGSAYGFGSGFSAGGGDAGMQAMSGPNYSGSPVGRTGPAPTNSYGALTNMGGLNPVKAFTEQNKLFGNEANIGQDTQALLTAAQQNGWSPEYLAQNLGFTTQQMLDHFNKYAPGSLNGNAWADQNQTKPAQIAGGYGYGAGNPSVSSMAYDIGRRTQQGLGQAFNAIRSNAVGVGGLGGSRQGVAEGVATGQAMDSLQGNLANLFGTDWTNQQNRNLQRYGIDTNAALGWGGLDNQRYGMDQSFYTAQRGQDLQQLGLGASLYNQGVNGPWGPLSNANSIYSPYTGLGTTTQNTGGGSNNWQNILGGLLGGAQFGKQMGWWG